MAEVYWDLEWTMLQQGFDYAYDKRLYDRLREGHARPVREHLQAGLDYQNKLARFLENHDEPRAAATFSPEDSPGGGGHHVPVSRAAFLPPGAIPGAKEADLSPSGVAVRTNPSTRGWSSSTIGCWPCCASRSSAKASGNCSSAYRPGRATGPGIVSWPLPGKGRWRAAAGGGELCSQPEPVLRPATVHGPRGWRVAAAESDGGRRLRSGGQRSAIARIVPGCAPLAGLCLRPDEEVMKLIVFVAIGGVLSHSRGRLLGKPQNYVRAFQRLCGCNT